MRRRPPYALFAIAAILSLASANVGGRRRGEGEGRPTKAWSQPRTPDGQPDLQGYWTNATFTPLERPAELAGKEFLTEAEAALYQQQQELRENSQSKDDIHYDNVIWQSESYAKGVSHRRSSLIFEPAVGRVPPLTANAQKRAAAGAAEARSRGPADAVEYRSLGERCISWGNEGPPMLGATYYNNLQIFQSSNAVVIRHELRHGIRVIPLDGRPHVGPNIHLQGGDGRVLERFTRVDADSILYQFTLDDLTRWTRSWSGEILMRKWDGPIYEYACHEGNYGLGFILNAARAQEKPASDQPTK